MSSVVPRNGERAIFGVTAHKTGYTYEIPNLERVSLARDLQDLGFDVKVIGCTLRTYNEVFYYCPGAKSGELVLTSSVLDPTYNDFILGRHTPGFPDVGLSISLRTAGKLTGFLRKGSVSLGILVPYKRIKGAQGELGNIDDSVWTLAFYPDDNQDKFAVLNRIKSELERKYGKKIEFVKMTKHASIGD